jgi:hypothetical protein
MTVKIVQTINRISPSAGVAATSSPITLKSGQIRVSTAATGAYIDIGPTPVATINSLHIPAQTYVIIRDRIARQPIAGITTGASTIVTFAENAGNTFLTSDYVAIEGSTTSGINTNFAQVTAVTDGTMYQASTVTINWNTSSITGAIDISKATLGRVTKISALGAGAAADVSIVEVQISGVM